MKNTEIIIKKTQELMMRVNNFSPTVEKIPKEKIEKLY